MRASRRRFLALAGFGLVAGGSGGYAWHRGMRYPPPLLAGTGPVTHASAGSVQLAAEGAAFQGMDGEAFRYRAFVPEPSFQASGDGGRETAIIVENLHPGARLEPGTGSRGMDESRQNLERTVTLAPAPGGEAAISWRFPKTGQYRFAAIGDSGGGTELQWVLRRAAELGADFLIHLGDLYYEKGDFDRAAENLAQADIPVYAAIGNHDFHDGWEVLYPEFHRVAGPSNSIFTLGGIEFVNFDTAADFIPAERGRRARILGALQPLDAASVRDRVAFTHMPLRDPDAERSHAVGRRSEARWIRQRLLATGTRNLLVGHIHIKEEFDDQGLHTYITGQGLAHADLIGPQAYRQYAEILLGDVEPGEPVRYRWQSLKMPFEAHCNERNLGMFDTLKRPDVKARLMELCGKA